MEICIENQITNIFLEGRIDTANAPSIEKEIWGKVDFENTTKIIIDAENLIMISSAGLRIILKIRKLCNDLLIKGVNHDVYEVFEMTGFTEMIKIEKAYRKFSVDNCEILGEGSNGIVYRYDNELVIKVYKKSDALKEIERERNLARKALFLGIPTAIPFDIVKVGEHYGSVFELLNAKSFADLINEHPEKIDEYIILFVDLLKKIHETQVVNEDFYDMKKTVLDWVTFLQEYLPKDQAEKLILLVKNVNERNTMIHGDYHVNNVEMQDGEVLLIDMDTLAFGHPIFEFGSMFLGFQAFGELDNSITLNFMKLPYEKTTYIWKKTLELYFNTKDKDYLEQIENKAKIIGYARLLRRTIRRNGFEDSEQLKVINNCKNKLSDLLKKVDSLDF